MFMLVFTGTDRIGHFLWDAYGSTDNQYHAEFCGYFKKTDDFIGELYNQLNSDDTIVLMSDHGFEQLESEVFINRYLYEWGYLKLRQFPAKSYNDIDHGTTAFCLDPGRIYLNYKEKYPRGSVNISDRNSSFGISAINICTLVCDSDSCYVP